jgi:hypothetical protein
MSIDQIHKTFSLVHILKDKLTFIAGAALDNGQIFAWHDKVWAARQRREETIQ